MNYGVVQFLHVSYLEVELSADASRRIALINRLAPSFHETFPLTNERLASTLEVARNRGGEVTTAALAEATKLGTRMYKPFLSWLYGTGLGLRSADGSVVLTSFGNIVASRLSLLNDARIVWLMHCAMSGSNGPGPLFWHQAVSHFSSFGEPFGNAEWTDYFQDRGDVESSASTISGQWTPFVKTYTSGTFKPLQILAFDAKSKRAQFVPPFIGPGSDVFAYLLNDYWRRNWGDNLTVSIGRLYEPGGLAEMLFLSKTQVEDYLSDLAHDGFLDIYRVAPPYQIARRWHDFDEQRSTTLRRMFGDDGSR